MEVYGVVERPRELTREARRRINALWFHTPNTLHDLVHDDTGRKYGTVIVDHVDNATHTITARGKDGVLHFRCSETGHWKVVTDDEKGELDMRFKEYSLRPTHRTVVHPRTPLQTFNAAAFSEPARMDLHRLEAVPTDLEEATVDAHNRVLGYREIEANWEQHLAVKGAADTHPEGPHAYERSMQPAIKPLLPGSQLDQWFGEEVIRRQGAGARYTRSNVNSSV